MTVAVAGAAEPEAVRRLAEKYFGGWSAVDPRSAVVLAPSLTQLEGEPSARPTPPGPLDYAASSRAGPLLMLGYYRPSLLAPSGGGVALEVASDVLTAGRTGRLNQLTQSGRLLGVSASPAYPSELHAGLSLFTARPAPGDSPQHAAALIQEQLDRLADGGPTPQELNRVKKAARTELLGALGSNAGLASVLVTYEVRVLVCVLGCVLEWSGLCTRGAVAGPWVYSQGVCSQKPDRSRLSDQPHPHPCHTPTTAAIRLPRVAGAGSWRSCRRLRLSLWRQ